MYVKEASWYKKQQKQKFKVKRIRQLSMFVLLFCVYFGVAMSLLVNMEKVNAQTLSSVSVQSLPLAENMSVEVKNSKVECSMTEQEVIIEELVEEETERTYLIAIDAGHGGEDDGCSFKGVDEKDINLYLAQSLQKKLEEMGFEVLLTREDDSQLDLAERVSLANEAQADAFISIHQNSCEDGSAAGVETWYCMSKNENSKRLATLVQQYTVLYTKARDRGILSEDELYVIRESEMPSCLVETGFLSNAKEWEKLQEEAYCEKIVQGIADAVQLYFYPKVMYLTFDDGPVAENTERVLDILKEKGIKATFFVVGKNVERNPEIAKRIVEEGHTIGIHCYEHEYKEIYASVDSYLEDFEKARQVVYEVTGEEVKLFRFPGGSINSYNKKVYEDIISEMTQQGYVYFDWNASLEDAVKKPTAEKIIQNAKESTLGRKKVIMLAHDIVDTTVECLEELLEQFPEYEMRELDESVEAIQF